MRLGLWLTDLKSFGSEGISMLRSGSDGYLGLRACGIPAWGGIMPFCTPRLGIRIPMLWQESSVTKERLIYLEHHDTLQ